MPASYTHYSFAGDVLANIDNFEIRRIIEENIDLYFIGCHGADINFFYKPYKGSAIVDQAYQIHYDSGAVFFTNALQVIEKCEDHDACWAYLLGFLTHFILDSNCHPYINNVIEGETAEYHQTIESQYDRRFIIKDGYDPMTKKVRDHIVISDFNAAIIAPFFALRPKDIMNSLRGFIRFDGFFVTQNKLRRKLTNKFLRMMKKDNFTGLFMRPGPEIDNLSSYLDHLDTLYQKSLQEAPKIINDFYCTKEITSRFDRNFE